MRHTLRLAAALLTIASTPAQNCGNTSTGLVPLTDLGTGTYSGFQGGLYPGGGNARPLSHTIDGLAQAAQVVPRDAAGAPSPTGAIVFLSLGMSNCTQEFSRFVQLANADPLRHARVRCIDGAQGGATASFIMDPTASFWTVVMQRLASQGATAEQVQAIWLKTADAGPTQGFTAYAQTLRSEFTAILQVIHDKFPNARICLMASRIYAGYATSGLNPEPYAYAQGFATKWTIEDQIAGSPALVFDPALGPVEAPWIDWGTYNWADGLVPRGDGLTWLCSDFQADGTHPGASGREKVAQRLLEFVHSDPVSSSWYLASPLPHAYGVGKTTSIGSVPAIGWTGSPRLSTNDFAVNVANALPNGVGILFHGGTTAAVPFLNATRYVGGTLTRLAVHPFSPQGGSSWSIPVAGVMVGTTRCYQGYMRDVAHPDGTGAVVSDGLRVVFSN